MSQAFAPRVSIALILALVASLCSAETISLRADPWLPYNGVGSQSPAGYMIDAARLIARANGHSIEYLNLPWEDTLVAVRKGDYDCAVGAAIDDADDFMFPTVSWGKSQNAFFGMAETTWRYTDPTSLDAVRLAVIADYSYSDELDAYIETHATDGRVVVIKGARRATISAVSNLVARKADVFVEDVNVMQQTLATMTMTDRVINLGTLDELTDVYIACTPAHPRGKQYAQMFSDGLVKLRASGELQTILDRYGLKDWASEGPE